MSLIKTFSLKRTFCCGMAAMALVRGPLMADEYEGRAILQDGPASSVKLRVDAKNPTEAKRILESQFRIKRWTSTPKPVK